MTLKKKMHLSFSFSLAGPRRPAALAAQAKKGGPPAKLPQGGAQQEPANNVVPLPPRKKKQHAPAEGAWGRQRTDGR